MAGLTNTSPLNNLHAHHHHASSLDMINNMIENQIMQQDFTHSSPAAHVPEDDESSSTITTLKQRQAFERNGCVVISGLLSKDELSHLVDSGQRIVDAEQNIKKGSLYFKIAERGIMICGPSNPAMDDADEKADIAQGFRNVALRSKLPRVAAELMGLDATKEETVKVLRDIFLGKSVHEEKCCGWHVDDHSFWPQSYKHKAAEDNTAATPPTDGINAWIAMRDMPAQYGGSLGLAPGSHKAEWRHDAYENLGLDFNKADQTKEQVYQSIKENGFLSCILDQTSPELTNQMDQVGLVPDLKCGDVIFHTRWLFHKTVPLTPDGKEYYTSPTSETKTDCLNRYSIRYVPGSAQLPSSFVNELSILSDPTNAGKALSDVKDAWYPTVWPSLDDDIDTKLLNLALGRIPDATKTMQSNLNELLTILSPPVVVAEDDE
jgi:hypothetical protein